MKNNYFLLFEDCRIVEGYHNAILYDLNRSDNTNVIPKSLIEVVEKCKNIPLKEVIDSYEKQEKEIVEEYIEFLLEREFGFMADEHLKNQIGVMSLDFETPSEAYNSIICIDSDNINRIEETTSQLDRLLCMNIEFRCKQLSKQNFEKLLNSFLDSVLEGIIIRVEYNNFCTREYIENVLEDRHRVKHIFIYNSPFYEELEKSTFITQSTDFYQDCGFIEKENFVINQPFFIESQSCNTCLNKKISIDFDGNIKGCPSMQQNYGNINVIDLKEVIRNNDFQKLWKIKKDEIDVCKDCEYRYMCTDCRVFTDNEKNPYSRPSKCNYNPYIAKWKGEEGYKTLEECGVISTEKEFTIDHNKITEINKELWKD